MSLWDESCHSYYIWLNSKPSISECDCNWRWVCRVVIMLSEIVWALSWTCWHYAPLPWPPHLWEQNLYDLSSSVPANQDNTLWETAHRETEMQRWIWNGIRRWWLGGMVRSRNKVRFEACPTRGPSWVHMEWEDSVRVRVFPVPVSVRKRSPRGTCGRAPGWSPWGTPSCPRLQISWGRTECIASATLCRGWHEL